MTTQNILNRLAHIKHLFKSGVEQSNQSETTCYIAILSFHDSIDWFMNLSCIRLGISEKEKQKKIGKTQVMLMDYFKIIQTLTLEAPVEKVNKLRNRLKHDFIIPAQIEVQECKNITSLFLSENTRLIFDCEFDDISIADLIDYQPVKDLLRNAIKFQAKGEIENSIIEISKAVFELNQIDINYIRSKNQFSHIDIYNVPFIKIPNLEDKPEMQALKLCIDSTINTYNKNFQAINESMKIFSLGIDYRKYSKLKSFIPETSFKDQDGIYSVTKPRNLDTIKNEDLSFAIDFIIDCCLQVEKFKFS